MQTNELLGMMDDPVVGAFTIICAEWAPRRPHVFIPNLIHCTRSTTQHHGLGLIPPGGFPLVSDLRHPLGIVSVCL